jgi:hypothetical protein
MEIAGVSQMAARVGVSECYYERVKMGMGVKVKIPSMDGVILDGTVVEVEFLFEDKRRADAAGSIYSIQENLGETQFFVLVKVATRAGTELKPGTMAEVVFPFNGEEGS